MSRKIGNIGELIAIDYLEKQGYQLITSNYQASHYEIDVIAIKDGILCFVEVKNYKNSNHNLYYAINKKKQLFLIRAAKTFMAKTPKYQDYLTRFDAIFISHSNYGHITKIVLAEDIFRPEYA